MTAVPVHIQTFGYTLVLLTLVNVVTLSSAWFVIRKRGTHHHHLVSPVIERWAVELSPRISSPTKVYARSVRCECRQFEHSRCRTRLLAYRLQLVTDSSMSLQFVGSLWLVSNGWYLFLLGQYRARIVSIWYVLICHTFAESTRWRCSARTER